MEIGRRCVAVAAIRVEAQPGRAGAIQRVGQRVAVHIARQRDHRAVQRAVRGNALAVIVHLRRVVCAGHGDGHGTGVAATLAVGDGEAEALGDRLFAGEGVGGRPCIVERVGEAAGGRPDQRAIGAFDRQIRGAIHGHHAERVGGIGIGCAVQQIARRSAGAGIVLGHCAALVLRRRAVVRAGHRDRHGRRVGATAAVRDGVGERHLRLFADRKGVEGAVGVEDELGAGQGHHAARRLRDGLDAQRVVVGIGVVAEHRDRDAGIFAHGCAVAHGIRCHIGRCCAGGLDGAEARPARDTDAADHRAELHAGQAVERQCLARVAKGEADAADVVCTGGRRRAEGEPRIEGHGRAGHAHAAAEVVDAVRPRLQGAERACAAADLQARQQALIRDMEEQAPEVADHPARGQARRDRQRAICVLEDGHAHAGAADEGKGH